MSYLKVSDITIVPDTATYSDTNFHYIASFVLSGAGVLTNYQVLYSSDGGTTFMDITANTAFVGTTANYFSATQQAHVLEIIPFAAPLNLSTDLPSYDTAPDYTLSTQNRFDIYDGKYKMMVYKPLQNKWTPVYQWQPDCMEYLGSKLFGWKNGTFYLHNEDFTSYNTIYGDTYPQRVCFPINIQGGVSVVKQVLDVALEGNGIIPNYAVLYSKFPKEQITDLIDTDWQQKEDVLYTFFLRDRLSEVADTPDGNLTVGDIVSSQTPMVMIEFSEYKESLNSLFLNLGVLVSKGHMQILK